MGITYLEALVAIVAIIAVFGVSGYIVVLIINLIRDWLVGRKAPKTDETQLKQLQEYEQRLDQVIKRVQNLETIIVDADIGNPELRETQQYQQNDPEKRATRSGGPLKNKLRT